jgi:carbon storage regulator
MLVIRRRMGESFRIGEDVEIQILESTGGQVKIGIRAPKDVSILRTEVWVTANQNKLAASAAVAETLTDAIVRQFFASPPNSSSSSE